MTVRWAALGREGAIRAWKTFISLVLGRYFPGVCPVCGNRTVFLETGPWLRDELLCFFCRSIPRQRAVVTKLEELYPDWKGLRILEPSPGGPTFRKFKKECGMYVPTRYHSGAGTGAVVEGMLVADLEDLGFDDESFDIVITQDVLEHVFDPAAAFREIMRVLKPGGAHIFTVPYYPLRDTVRRADPRSGSVECLLPPIYHGDPYDPKGALVVTEWGKDITSIIHAASGMDTGIFDMRDRARGIDGEFLEVFVSTKKDKYADQADKAKNG